MIVQEPCRAIERRRFDEGRASARVRLMGRGRSFEMIYIAAMEIVFKTCQW